MENRSNAMKNDVLNNKRREILENEFLRKVQLNQELKIILMKKINMSQGETKGKETMTVQQTLKQYYEKRKFKEKPQKGRKCRANNILYRKVNEIKMEERKR